VYAILSNNCYQPTTKQKLMTMFELTKNDIKQIYKLPLKTKKNCKFQWLQYRINNFRLTTNTFLYKIKIKQDPLCSFYSTERILAIKQENLEVFNNSWNCCSTLLYCFMFFFFFLAHLANVSFWHPSSVNFSHFNLLL
jgi:hypothetical protein